MLRPIPSGLYVLEFSFRGGEGGDGLFGGGEGGWFLLCPLLSLFLRGGVGGGWSSWGGGSELKFGGGGDWLLLLAVGSGRSRWGKRSLLSIIQCHLLLSIASSIQYFREPKRSMWISTGTFFPVSSSLRYMFLG